MHRRSPAQRASVSSFASNGTSSIGRRAPPALVGRHPRRVVIDDQPVPAALAIDKAVARGQGLRLTVLHVRERVVTAVHGDVAVDPDHLLAECDLVSRERLVRPLEITPQLLFADEQLGREGPHSTAPSSYSARIASGLSSTKIAAHFAAAAV